jgi:hypothetical protein
MVYLLSVLMVFALWAGLSAAYFWQARWQNIYWGRIFLVLFMISGLIKIFQVRQEIDPRMDHIAADFAEDHLQIVPGNAILLTSADDDTFPLWYYHYGLSWRPDVRVITLGLLQFDWYRQNFVYIYPGLKVDPFIGQVDEIWMRQLSEQNGDVPVCRSWPADNQIQYQCYPFGR